MKHDSKTERPGINAGRSTAGRIFDAASAVAMIGLVFFPLWYYPQLPETIPTHYGADGMPDAWGNKSNLWLLPVIGVLMYFGLMWLANVPHIYNYPVKVTPANAEKLYKTGSTMVRMLNAMVTGLFFYINYRTIEVALGKKEDLGGYLIIGIIVLFTVPLLYFIVRLIRTGRRPG